MTQPVVDESLGVLAAHGRTFRLAARLLPANVRDDAAVVYAFCRVVDDLADESTDAAEARGALTAVRAELDRTAAPRPVIAALFDVAARRGMDLSAARHLIDAVTSDLGTVRIRDDRALIGYCYGVAGTVGLMMTSVLGGSDRRAAPHAIDLGIAMQLTNLCRDVAEDAARGRVYLPETRLRARGVAPEDLLCGEADPTGTARVVAGLLALADRYYESGRAGLSFLPWRTRWAIHVAAAVYRAIGVRLLRRHRGNPLAGRTVVPPLERIGWAVVGLWEGLKALVAPPHPHERTLHEALRGLPGADSRSA
jgi:phytoene synthase